MGWQDDFGALEYHGIQMNPTPTRVVTIDVMGPLASDEPAELESFRFLAEGDMALSVELQPGDGTRYGLVLVRVRDGFTVNLIGQWATSGIVVRWGEVVRPLDAAPLSENGWTIQLMAWWLTGVSRRFSPFQTKTRVEAAARPLDVTA